MKPMTIEWVAKAEEDFAIMERESRARKDPSHGGVCFHAQQCIEKYLKARLCEAGAPIRKIHNLAALLTEVVILEPSWELFRPDLTWLSNFSVEIRYPGVSADAIAAKKARNICREFRAAARQGLGMKE
jgi:HEPN domain-containing protein